jgi:putative effector of murein hydrolase LrgA (UPF0299 family)
MYYAIRYKSILSIIGAKIVSIPTISTILTMAVISMANDVVGAITGDGDD